MAQHVGYFQNYPFVLTEGPFVVVYAGGYRIEVDRVRAICPGHPDLSIYKLLDAWGFYGKTEHSAPADEACDRLNQLVRLGHVVYDESKDTWLPVPPCETQYAAPSWAAFQTRMNAMAAKLGASAPFPETP
jgi:hypothetical protein